MSSVKGKLFEYFVYRMLLSCGFHPVSKDDLIIFKGQAGMMIQGLGQPHNADVLVSPPIQIPFHYPTRLLIECKCLEDAVGLPIIRNALGLREDINRFDIVTEEILKNRQKPGTKKKIYYDLQRYNYQVAVASMNGFKVTAFPYAKTHRIPLISFRDNLIFEEIRNCIERIEEEALKNKQVSEYILNFLKNSDHQLDYYCESEYECFDIFMKAVHNLEIRISIGVLEDGNIIFLYKEDNNLNENLDRLNYEDGYSIYWSRKWKAWELRNETTKYLFELPKEIYDEWIKQEDNKYIKALRIKQDHLSKIVLFDNINRKIRDKECIKVLYISQNFMNNARRQLERD